MLASQTGDAFSARKFSIVLFKLIDGLFSSMCVLLKQVAGDLELLQG